MKTFGSGEQVVLSMIDHLHNKNHEVYLNNYFTSIPLLEHLKNVGVRACGTIKRNIYLATLSQVEEVGTIIF